MREPIELDNNVIDARIMGETVVFEFGSDKDAQTFFDAFKRGAASGKKFSVTAQLVAD